MPKSKETHSNEFHSISWVRKISFHSFHSSVVIVSIAFDLIASRLIFGINIQKAMQISWWKSQIHFSSFAKYFQPAECANLCDIQMQICPQHCNCPDLPFEWRKTNWMYWKLNKLWWFNYRMISLTATASNQPWILFCYLLWNFVLCSSSCDLFSLALSFSRCCSYVLVRCHVCSVRLLSVIFHFTKISTAIHHISRQIRHRQHVFLFGLLCRHKDGFEVHTDEPVYLGVSLDARAWSFAVSHLLN